MMLIDLVRHGETELPGRLLGRTDPPLTPVGLQQIARQTTGRAFDAIVASPRRRTLEPAERLAGEHGVPLRIDEDWAELDFGDWDGKESTELSAGQATADAFAALYRSPDAGGAPGGESWRALEARICRGLDRLFAAPTPQSALIITHAGPMRAALSLICGLPFSHLWTLRIDPGTRLTLRAGRDRDGRLWGEILEVVQP
jgi:alpha-ribazole phosphatase